MATTPPLQIASTPETPLTPLHGATYDREFFGAARRSTRTSSRIASKASRQIPSAEASPRELQGEASVTTPRSTRRRTSRPSSGLHSPQVTPENKAARRVQVISPSSPDVQASRSKPPPPSKSHLQPLASSSTTISDGMLPTPVKTPKKKLIPKASTAARALFQDSTQNTTSVIGGDPSPRRNRKNKRYNGFSLESFSAGDEDGRDQIQIFTDSRDMVPQADKTKTNPFLEHHVNGETSSTKKVAGTTKRRKISGERKLDPQVEEAIRQDEGMVYVFRGKKVYRRFDDDDDEEEEIDPDDLGLLENTPGGSDPRPLKSLTRRSIKPKRLFQSEAQKRARELEKDEEALTDIEDSTDHNVVESLDMDMDTVKSGEPAPMSSSGRSLRSAARIPTSASVEGDTNEGQHRSSKKASPFDSWPRLKNGGRTSSSQLKGKKRGAAESVEDNTMTGSFEVKKTKA